MGESHVNETDALAAVDGVSGFLSHDQASRLFRRARDLRPPATIVEIGSYHGRSAIVLALAAPDCGVVAIDPFAGNDRGPQQIAGSREEGEADMAAFRANLERAGVTASVRHVRLPSGDALDEVDGEVDLLFVDGAHRYAPARDDLARWGARVRSGGTLLVHDAFSSVGVTLAIMRLLAFGRGFRYVGRSRSLAEYRREELRGRVWPANALRQLAQLPWFARNVGIKLALVARMRPVARALGGEEWPY